jgi:hypothetical protein
MTEADAEPATLHFADGEFAVLKGGRFIACAVSGRPVPLEILRYWSVDRQEAYAGPREAVQRMAPAR